MRVALDRDFGLSDSEWRHEPAVLVDSGATNFVFGWEISRKLRRTCCCCTALAPTMVAV